MTYAFLNEIEIPSFDADIIPEPDNWDDLISEELQQKYDNTFIKQIILSRPDHVAVAPTQARLQPIPVTPPYETTQITVPIATRLLLSLGYGEKHPVALRLTQKVA